ncbi:MAG: nucleotide exchange factor GrpE, partial [Nitrososphaeraceae archaeon]
ASNSDGEGEEVIQQGSSHDEKDQDYVLNLENQLSQTEEERQKAKEEADSNMNKLRYLMADFDNYRKRMERQVESKINQGKAELILKFVSIHDDLSRAVETAKQGKSEQFVIEGLEGILRNVETLFDAEGVKEIETTGTPFDPNIHDAISFKFDDTVPENTVIAEIRKGYMISDKVLRPSLVEISKKIVKNSVNDSNRTKGD